jgi:hypothetical protein
MPILLFNSHQSVLTSAVESRPMAPANRLHHARIDGQNVRSADLELYDC